MSTPKPTRRRSKVGLPPGTLVHTGEQMTEQSKLTLITYDPRQYDIRILQAPAEIPSPVTAQGVIWVNVDGLHQIDLIAAIGKKFNVHPLVLEDIVNVGQRPKLEDFGDHLYLVLQMVTEQSGRLAVEQISLVIGKNFVLSFQERQGDIFDPVRERIKNGSGRLRAMGPDYLAYALMDTIVDHYFVLLERVGERAERAEEAFDREGSTQPLREIHAMKRQLIVLRRAVWPLRDVIGGLERGGSPLFQDATRVYLRDLYDHAIRAIDTVETLRDLLAGLLDLYVSTITNKLNEVMKVLTIISTIFIPLTFITSIYGMNFQHMPELNSSWGYPVVMLIMAAVAGGMLLYFRKRKWL